MTRFGTQRDVGRSFWLKGNTSKKKDNAYSYAGRSIVLVLSSTPIIVEYQTKSQKATVSFYIQRYNSEDIPAYAALQAKLNQSLKKRS